MPTKFLAVETPHFQLGANAGPETERCTPADFQAKVAAHSGSDTLFVLAPSELGDSTGFVEALNGPSPVTLALFSSAADAIKFLPSLPIFSGNERSQGVKDALAAGSTVFAETFFNAKNLGSRLDPFFAQARSCLGPAASVNAWTTLQALVMLGVQNLPLQGEKGTGERVDVQAGSDDKIVTLTVRFDLPPEQFAHLRANPIAALPRLTSEAIECRYLADAKKVEFNCVYFRGGWGAGPVRLFSYHASTALEASGRSFQYKSFSGIDLASAEAAITAGAAPAPAAPKPAGGGGFKKKFSERVKASAPAPEESATVKGGGMGGTEPKVVVSGDATLNANELDAILRGNENSEPITIVKGSAPTAEGLTMVKGSAPTPEAITMVKGGGGPGETITIVKGGDGGMEKILGLEARIRELEANMKTREDLLAQANAEIKTLKDPKKDGVINSMKDAATAGLQKTIKDLEGDLETARSREKELMKMVDKAVQMKDEAAKKIKELDLKLKQASGAGGSKVQMLEKAIDEQKRQNKELSKRVTELTEKLKSAA